MGYGTATVELRGECVRCLGGIVAEQQIDVQELYVYPGSDATEEEASRLEGDLLDLEPLLQDDGCSICRSNHCVVSSASVCVSSAVPT